MTIKQSIQFAAPAARVYEILVTGELFSKMSGAPADIDSSAGGKLSLFGGYIEGSTIEVVPNQSVRQQWRSKDWPAEQVSTVHFQLEDNDGATTLNFEHSDFPEEMREHLEAGWHQKYWEPLQSYLAQ